MTDATDPPGKFRPEARIPRGLQDRRGRDVALERALLARVTAVYEKYGFEPLETSAFEYADALGKFLPDADRPNEGVFALQDDDEQWMALRYDLTAPLARFAAQHWETLPKPFRRYAYGPVWRNEKPGPGRFREFTQCDADIVGSDRPEADAEIIAMAVEGLETVINKDGLFPIPFASPLLKINSRKILDGLLTKVGATGQGQRLAVLRAVDKFDRLGPEGVTALLGEGRRDESGDFTKGAGLSTDAIYQVYELLVNQGVQKSRSDVLNSLSNLVGGTPEGDEGLNDLRLIDESLTAIGVGSTKVIIDASVVRGLEYYTGAVFEAELRRLERDHIGELIGPDGSYVRFGSIGGGGRYDDLVARFTGERTPATGFSFGVSRLVAALKAAGRDEGLRARGPVVIIAFNSEYMPLYFEVASELRNAAIPAEVYLGSSGMRAQMKYADRRMSPAAVIIGDDERAAGTVTVKDLDLGRDLAAKVTDNAEWRAERPGQATIPRAELIPFIRRILGDES